MDCPPSLQCKEAVKVGRANRAGFAEIGKVFTRMAKAAVKMGDKEQAIVYLDDAQVLTPIGLERQSK